MSWNSRGDLSLEVPKEQLPALALLLKKHEREDQAKSVLDSKRYGGDTATLYFDEWEEDLVKDVIGLLQREHSPRSLISLLKGYGRIISNPETAVVKNLELLPRMLALYLLEDAIDGWVYLEVAGGRHVAFVVEDIEYHPPHRDSPAFVIMDLKANVMEFNGEDRHDDGIEHEKIYFYRDDIVKRPVAEILLNKGIRKETEELKKEYTESLELFQQYQPKFAQQFLCSGVSLNARETNNWWQGKSKCYELTLYQPTKMVNDEGILKRKYTLACSSYFWEGYKPSTAFSTIPIHPYILFYDLTRHVYCWMHVQDCQPYVYDPSLRGKLVLPDVHRDLIDVLTTDIGVFADDIIAGKSGGTAILCYGEPGLGKTLTAEVYSELVEKPLYRVHAGQLGTDLETVERELEIHLRRANRWGAVGLIDEADVYIRRRDNNLQHNAVVSAFLMKLEYFNGLLFMTTNRVNDVDDAIVSRMVAMFKYETPDSVQARKIWKVLSKQFGISLSAAFIAELVKQFPDLSGRDIKQLLKLTSKYCKQRKQVMDVEAFRVCAMFRGIA